MPAQLVALTGGPSIVLDKPILLLGRHPECDIQIDSRKISRRHCCIAQVGEYLVVRDLDSTNGIRINGDRVQEGKLHPGDELTIGNHRYQVAWDDLPAPHPGAMRREPARPAMPPVALDDDEVLESFDEPVPLAEPVGSRKSVPPLGRPLRPPSPSREVPESPLPEPDPEPLILPDDIHLAPGSDVGHAAPSSPSHQ
jgi:predicted component of type VI protein secretion system